MEFFATNTARRSIRRFTGEPVSRMAVESIVRAGIDAPSAKNRQPWRFVVVQDERDGMIAAMRAGLDAREATAQTEMERGFLAGARHSMTIMQMAPVNILVLNTESKPPEEALCPYGERFLEMANVQSIGAAIQNMCLAATALGLGSLWIADVYDAYPCINAWLGTDEVLVAVLSIGHADEQPAARPRKALTECAAWR